MVLLILSFLYYGLTQNHLEWHLNNDYCKMYTETLMSSLELTLKYIDLISLACQN